MSFSKDELWWAYIDGELTPAEAIAFQQTLTPEEHERLLKDMEWKNTMGDAVGVPVTCPASAWKAVLRQVEGSRRFHTRMADALGRFARGRVIRYSLAVMPLAAMLVVAIATFVVETPVLESAKPVQAAFLNVSDSEACVPASNTVTGVREFLEQRAIQVALDPTNSLDSATSPYRLIGASEQHFLGEPVITIHFESNGQRAKIIIAPKGGAAAEQIGRAVATGVVGASRPIGDLVVAVVGAVPSELISMLVDPRAMQLPTPSNQTPPVVEQPQASQPQPQAQPQPVEKTEPPQQQQPAVSIPVEQHQDLAPRPAGVFVLNRTVV